MTRVHETTETCYKETSLAFPILAPVVLFFWGNSQLPPVVISINTLVLIDILGGTFGVVRHADVLVHRFGESCGLLILSLSAVILEVSLIPVLVTTGDAAPALVRDTLYSITIIVTGGLVGFSLLLGGRKLATQHMNLFDIKQYLIALSPLAIIVLVFPMALPGANFITVQALLVALISTTIYGVFLPIQIKTHQSLFIYKHEDEGGDNDSHRGKPSAHSNMWYAARLIIYLIAAIAVAKTNASPLETLLTELDAPVVLTDFLVVLLILLLGGLDALKMVSSNQVQQAMSLSFGLVLATISLAIPVVTLIVWATGNDSVFVLGAPEMTMMVSSLVLRHIPFPTGCTNVLNDTVYLALSIVHLMTILA